MSVAERCPCCGQIGVVTRRPSWAFTERSPEPSAEPATGRDRSQAAGGEPRYTLDEVADMIGAEINRVRGNGTEGWSNVIRWLRSGGATTETGESE
jgi:hypothetical protein